MLAAKDCGTDSLRVAVGQNVLADIADQVVLAQGVLAQVVLAEVALAGRKVLADIEGKRGLPGSDRALAMRSTQSACVGLVDEIINNREVRAIALIGHNCICHNYVGHNYTGQSMRSSTTAMSVP